MAKPRRDRRLRSRKDNGYGPRAKRIDVRELRKKILPLILRKIADERRYQYKRPKVRGECKNGIRPCPFVGCRYHLFLDVSEAGSIVLNFPGKEPWELQETCALDVADRQYECTLEFSGMLLNLTRERARQIEAQAMDKIREELKEAREMRVELERMRDRRLKVAR